MHKGGRLCSFGRQQCQKHMKGDEVILYLMAEIKQKINKAKVTCRKQLHLENILKHSWRIQNPQPIETGCQSHNVTVMLSGSISKTKEFNTDEKVESERCRSDWCDCGRLREEIAKMTAKIFQIILVHLCSFSLDYIGKIVTTINCIILLYQGQDYQNDVFVCCYFVLTVFFPCYVQY